MTKDDLIGFEDRVKEAFLAKKIRAPIHLSNPDQAEPLIQIFKMIRPQDWVFSTWRSHFHALLKGIPQEDLFQQILDGRSMFVMSKFHNFMSSAIVGGMLPIALGVAMGIKKRKTGEHVWVFIGDMCAKTGVFHEFRQYAKGHTLPVNVVIEDNGLSTDTPTDESWGLEMEPFSDTIHYHYQREHPHVGVGQHVSF